MFKVFATIAIFITLLLASAAPTFAADKFSPTLDSYQKALGGDDYNKQTYDFQSLIGVTGGLATMLVGCIDPQCPKSLKVGSLHKMGVAVAGIYANPPASGTYYVADVASKFHVIPEAYAQEGTGFRALQPFLNMWRASRNLAYLIFVLVIAGLGLAIMFRAKISPQAVITIQSALPRIIVALILITFSYAIAGFMVDLIYVAFGIVVWGFQLAGLYDINQATQAWNQYLTANIGTTFGFIVSHGIQGAGDILLSGSLPTTVLGGAGIVAIAFAVLNIVSVIGVALPVGAVGAAGLAAVFIPFLLAIAIGIFVFLLRVLLTLARAYLLLIIHLVLAPFFILFATITGRGIWEGWLRGLISNLLVFPAVALIIFLIDVLRTQIDAAWRAGTLWGPPYLGENEAILNGILALAGLALIPNVPDIINQILGVRALRVDLPSAQRQLDQGSQALQGFVTNRIKHKVPVV